MQTVHMENPGEISRYQIDYIMINQRVKNCVKQARTYPGTDVNSNHNPVTTKFKVKLKKNKKKSSTVTDRLQFTKGWHLQKEI